MAKPKMEPPMLIGLVRDLIQEGATFSLTSPSGERQDFRAHATQELGHALAELYFMAYPHVRAEFDDWRKKSMN